MCLNLFDNVLNNYLAIVTKVGQGYINGISGLILYLSYLNKITHKSLYIDQMNSLLDKAITSWTHNYSLGYGLAGISWAIEKIRKNNYFENINEWLVQVDKVLHNECLLFFNQNDTDYFSGGGGLLFYFLSKDEFSKVNIDIIDLYIKCIKTQITTDQWHQKNYAINLGTPHGLTGILLILQLIQYKTGNNTEQLVIDLADTLLKYSKQNEIYCFPSKIYNKGLSFLQSDLAWCYGDLMVGYAFLKARIHTDMALEVIIKSLSRTDCRTDNISLCHGHTSIALIYRQFFKLTGNQLFMDAYEKWKNQAIYLFNIHYDSYMTDKSYLDYFENPSLFYGFSGFFLSTLTFENLIDDEWTECLLF
jgi:lantibiotic modifying enzyme